MPPLAEGWLVARTSPGACSDPGGLDGLELEWLPARVPGTAAGALRDAGRALDEDFDASDWWFRVGFEASAGGEDLVLCCDGLATLAEVFVNGEHVLTSESMFVARSVAIGERLRGRNELAIRFRALAPELEVPRRPRARWRTKVAADGTLRFFRTSILGRAPGFAPGPAPVGPWRPVRLERRAGMRAEDVVWRARVVDGDGVLSVSARLRGGPLPAAVQLGVAGATAELPVADDGTVAGTVVVPGVPLWWPHTHGDPVLHDASLTAGDAVLASRRVGFRSLATSGDIEADGLDLHVNGVRVFARGAVWTPPDPVSFAAGEDEVRVTLEQARDAGLNLVRVVGTGVYEPDAFHAACDALGMLVWQDLMFANFDYPAADERFAAAVAEELDQVLPRVGAHPSTVVLCGNSEVEQQAAMLGLDPGLGRTGLWDGLVPERLAAADLDALWVPSAPTGGVLPFRPDRGVANYFGVGAYRLPLDDARRAGVRFASECLAFANVGASDEGALEGVPRDVGADWDFADVRDHYLETLFGVEALALRVKDPARYLELSRAVTGEVMAEVFGEWRRAGSPCGGGIVLWLRDVVAGSGWGLLDSVGRPKPVLAHLRRALAPVAVWTTDEQLSGIAVHVANDRPEPLPVELRVTLWSGEHRVEEAHEALVVPAHGSASRDVEAMIGRFVDAAYAYRFGPPAHDAVVATLLLRGEIVSQHFRFPAGRPLEPSAELGLVGSLDGDVLRVRSQRLAYGVRIHAPGCSPSDDAFSVEPGGERVVALRGEPAGPVELSALNLCGRVAV